MENNSFEKLREINVADKVEKKGQFSYLSWADAVAYLLKEYPQATWSVHEWENLPFTGTPDNGYMVAVSVEIGGIIRTQHHPILDHKNKTIFKPNAFDINTAIQRCLAKAIALHGLGLSLYTGEDLQDPPKTSPQKPHKAPDSPKEDKERIVTLEKITVLGKQSKDDAEKGFWQALYLLCGKLDNAVFWSVLGMQCSVAELDDITEEQREEVLTKLRAKAEEKK